VVLGFDGQFGAEGVLDDLNRWQEEGLIEIIDAVVVSREVSKNMETKQTPIRQGEVW
jgi:uncharacterized membrane protein